MLLGITRVRNESDIIQRTLDHVSQYVDGIVVYDDCSDDNTVEICESHPKVLSVLKGKTWESDRDARMKAEGTLRQKAYEEAMKLGATYVYCFDADEYIEPTIDLKNLTEDAYFFRLFDFYITEEDKDKDYTHRKWMGPEYRDILMIVKASPTTIFYDRAPHIPNHPEHIMAGYCKHYGKAISEKEWEDTCEYYAKHLPEPYKTKWEGRRGKAIHTISDFGKELITWEEKDKGIRM